MAALHFHGTVGLRSESELRVQPEHTAAHETNGALPPVLSTARLLQLVDHATLALAAPHLDDGYVSVGFQIVLEHLGPSEIGDSIVAGIVLEGAEDRDLLFRFTITNKGDLRTLARGNQTRRIVRMDDFTQKLRQERSLAE